MSILSAFSEVRKCILNKPKPNLCLTLPQLFGKSRVPLPIIGFILWYIPWGWIERGLTVRSMFRFESGFESRGK